MSSRLTSHTTATKFILRHRTLPAKLFRRPCPPTESEHPLNTLATLLTLVVPLQTDESIAVNLERGWRADLIVMLRERLPKVLFVLLALFVLQRLTLFAVHRMQSLAQRHGDTPQRAAQLRTSAGILRATAYSVLGFLAFLELLTLFNIDLKPLLTSAGIVGVGIGLAAQSLFKDIINGTFILIENQYNVGDTIRAASLTGTVEDLTLRTTRLRDADGTLHVIPNSQIATLSNLSRDFAVATLPVSVDASANPDRVLAILGRVASELNADPSFGPNFLAEPIVLGIDKIDGRAILYPITFRVLPSQKDLLLRELRRRVVLTFEHEGIPLGSDASMLVMQPTNNPPDPTAPPAQQSLTGS